MIGGREVEGIWVAGREREGSGMIRKRNGEDSNGGIRMEGFEWRDLNGGTECRGIGNEGD
jgi:hypothetical protein